MSTSWYLRPEKRKRGRSRALTRSLVLTFLHEYPGASRRQLCTHLCVSHVRVIDILDGMIEDGLIEAHKDYAYYPYQYRYYSLS
jgi:predicted transcriptional regulator